MRTSRQSPLHADIANEEALSSIRGLERVLSQDQTSDDLDNVPPTFRGQSDNPNLYFALTEEP